MSNFEQLPKEIQFFYYCNECINPYSDLLNKYRLDSNGIYNVIGALDEVVEKKIDFERFKAILMSVDLEAGNKSHFIIELLATRLLVMDAYFDNQVSETIKNLGGDPDEFADMIKTQEAAWQMEKENLVEIGEISPDESVNLNITKEREDVTAILAGDLSMPLSVTSVEAMKEIDQINDIVGMVLADGLLNKIDYASTFVSVLLNNNTILTNYQEENGSVVGTTVSDWLKDYLAFAGNRYADNLMMARYLIEAVKIKTLPDEEKIKVKNLLTLYRNLSGFNAAITSGADAEKIQFFPLDVLKMRYDKLLEPVVEKTNKVLQDRNQVEVEVAERPRVVVKEDSPLEKASKRYQVVINGMNIKVELEREKTSLTDFTTAQLIEVWKKSLTQNQSARALASLIELFKKNDFLIAWFREPEIREVLTVQAVAYPSLIDPAVREGVVSKAVIAVVLKAVLLQLGFSDEQVAAAYLLITGHDPKLASFVYFDAKKERFAWREFTDK